MATGTSSAASTSAFHDDDPEQSADYRSLSALAVIGLLIGLASPLCFGAPLLMIIPAAGIVVSLIALRQIANSEGALAGRWVATLGLVLSVVFLCAPTARATAIRLLRTSQADSFARDWLSALVAGKTDYAFRLSSDSTHPPAPPEPGRTTPPPNAFENFKGLPIVAALSAAGADADIRFVETTAFDPQGFQRVFVRERYDVVPKSGGADAKPIEVSLTLLRSKLPSEGRARWMVWSIEDANKPIPLPLPR
jgi:hypothetical protein